MGVEEDWIMFLEKNPHFYGFSKMPFLIELLESIDKKPWTRQEIESFLGKKAPEKERGMLDGLLSMNILSVKPRGIEKVYSLGAEGKKFLSIFRETSKHFSL